MGSGTGVEVSSGGDSAGHAALHTIAEEIDLYRDHAGQAAAGARGAEDAGDHSAPATAA